MIKYTIEKHIVAFPSKIAASAGSPHIYNIRLTADHDNGTLVGRGDWVAFDEYEETTAPTFAGIIREQAANGNWYVEVTADTEALFIYDSPIIAEDYNSEFKKESNFYNEEGKTVKAYSLIKGDIFELSAEAFTGTPEVGGTLTYASGKYTVTPPEDEDEEGGGQ